MDHGEAAATRRPRREWLRPVLLLGLVSLFTDVASEAIIPLLPWFLTTTLGAGALVLGLIEGLADATASVLKLLSGRWADRLGRTRPLVLAGYALSSCARPLVALAGSAWHVLAVRMADRTGKGIRTSPRDALLAASVPSTERGAAFGLHRAMDHAGAVIGPLLAAGFLTFVSRDLRALFAWTALPGAAALLVLWLGVREAPSRPEPAREEEACAAAGGGLARFLLPLGLFTLGNASDVFLLLKAGGTRAPLTALPLLWMGLHVAKMVASVPGGRLADRVGRRKVIAAGWVVYAAVYTGFAFAQDPVVVGGLFVAYGLYHGLTEAAEKALVAEMAPRARRGSAFGWYHLTLGLLALAASLLFGGLWEHAGSRAAFLTSAALALLAVLALAVLRPRLPEATAAAEA
jgi:MFS family permease